MTEFEEKQLQVLNRIRTELVNIGGTLVLMALLLFVMCLLRSCS